MNNPVTVRTIVDAPMATVWECWNEPEHIAGWAFASDDWEASGVENDLRAGGTFKIRMQAKDGSEGFDFTGTYSKVKKNEFIKYAMDDGREVTTEFTQTPAGVQITETFDPEGENPIELQRSGWQAILDNFKSYAEVQYQLVRLEQEGFIDVRVCPIPPNEDLPEHTHDEHTVHLILDGELTIVDAQGTRVFRPGDRVEFPAGTTHKARGATATGTMIIGVKK